MTELMLVNPLFLHDDPVEARLMTPYFPLGPLYIAAVAREAGYTVSIFDATFEDGDRAFSAALDRDQPRVVGFSVLTTVRKAALRLAALARNRGALVLMGGADPTARPAAYLNCRYGDTYPVDVVAVGEAEETILELLPVLLQSETSAPALEAIQGIAYRNAANGIVRTPRRPLIRTLDRLPLPARDLLDMDAYRRAWRANHGRFSLSLIATRGCPYECAWCQKTIFGRSYRPRAPEAVADEMRHIKERYAPDHLRIVDDVMGIDREWVHAWREAVLARDAAIPFECLSRVDLFDEEMGRLLIAVGCQRIAFGAESGSQRVLEAMNKGIRVEQIYQAAEICRRLGIETYFYMMVGYPGETWDDLKCSVRLLRETRPDAFSTTIAYPLPGTPFWEQVCTQLSDTIDTDWSTTAENRLLFQRGQYDTLFYRRVMRWFHSEWKAARSKTGVPATPIARLRAQLALWRDRIVVNLLAHMPDVARGRFSFRAGS